VRKQLVLVAFLIAAGCAETRVRGTVSGQQAGEPAVSSECDAVIAKGIQRLTAGLREYAPDPHTLENGISSFEKIQGALVRRCIVDSWPPEVAQCFATMERRTDLQTCQSKLGAESSSRLATELAELTSSKQDRCAASTAPARGRRSARSDGAREAMEMLQTYKAALCDCNDHDVNCGKVATDAYQRAMAGWAARNTGPGPEITARPDPEMEQLVTEIADCSKRVFTPAPAAGSASRPSPP
jgi:hypothetical protein